MEFQSLVKQDKINKLGSKGFFPANSIHYFWILYISESVKRFGLHGGLGFHSASERCCVHRRAAAAEKAVCGTKTVAGEDMGRQKETTKAAIINNYNYNT